MCYKLIECITFWDITSFILGILFSALTSIFIIKFFRPKILLGIPILENKTLKFPVKNLDKYNSVTNLRIEAAAILNDQTYHLSFDRYDFLMLTELNTMELGTPYERKFHAKDIEAYTKSIAENCKTIVDFFKLLENEQSYLRVRVHASHEFTGFGKAFQSNYRLKNYEFETINSINSTKT